MADYNGALPADKMRARINSDKAYREVFDRLSESGKLQTFATTYHNHGKESQQ